MFKVKCGFFYIKQPLRHLDQVSRENGRLGLKNENPCFENFSRVPGSWFCLGRGEESQVFLEVKHSKSQNVFFTMSSLELKCSRTISLLPIRCSN